MNVIYLVLNSDNYPVKAYVNRIDAVMFLDKNHNCRIKIMVVEE